jgi:hypothetical protein
LIQSIEFLVPISRGGGLYAAAIVVVVAAVPIIIVRRSAQLGFGPARKVDKIGNGHAIGRRPAAVTARKTEKSNDHWNRSSTHAAIVWKTSLARSNCDGPGAPLSRGRRHNPVFHAVAKDDRDALFFVLDPLV